MGPPPASSAHSHRRSFRESGSVHAALDFWRHLYRTSDRILGADHPDTLTNRHEYASAIRDTGNVPAAIAELEQLLPNEIRMLGADSPEVITTRHSIASYHARQDASLKLSPRWRPSFPTASACSALTTGTP